MSITLLHFQCPTRLVGSFLVSVVHDDKISLPIVQYSLCHGMSVLFLRQKVFLHFEASSSWYLALPMQRHLVFLILTILTKSWWGTVASRLSTHPFKYALFSRKNRVQIYLVQHVMDCHLAQVILCNTIEQSQWFDKYKLLNLWAFEMKRIRVKCTSLQPVAIHSSSSVFENQLASGSNSILSHTLSLLLMCRKVSDQLGEGMGCRDYRQMETKIEGASWVNLLWGVGHKWLQTIVVVSMCKELHYKPRQSAKRSAAVSGHGGKGSYSGSKCLSAECSRAESWDFLLSRVCGRLPADVLLARQSIVFLPSHACAKRGR